jgi:hypothetical protein
VARFRAGNRRMIGDDDLDAAVAAGLLNPELRAELATFAASRRKTESADAAPATQAAKFDPVHVLYYAGALLVIGAMGLFATAAFDGLGGWALAAIAIIYATGFLWLGNVLWAKPNTRIPGGLCVAVAVSMTPLAIYGIQDALGLWAVGKPGGYHEFYPLINGSWVYMEVGAVIAALIAHGRMPDWELDWELRLTVSKIFGLGLIAVAWAIDLKWSARGDFAFWLHLFGALTLWGAVTSGEGGEFSKAVYCAFNIAFIAFGLFLDRRIYAVFDAIGLAIYLGHLAFDVFKDALVFSFALSAIGLAVIFAGVFAERRRRALNTLFDAYLPEVLRALRPPRARHS